MPVGGKGKPAGGYRAGKKGSYGCAGFPTVSADGTVHGCHPTKAKAQAQARAIWASVARKFVPSVEKAMVSEGDFVAFICHDEEMKIGRVEYVMTEGVFGLTGSEYAMEATPEDPVLSIRIFEEEDGAWEETEYTVGHRASEVVKVESIKVAQDVIVEMTATPNGMMETSVNKSMYRVVQDNPGCSEGFAVVDEDGELEGCFATREEATIFAEANNKEEQMDNMDDMMEMGKARTMANAPYQDYNSQMQMEEEDKEIEEARRRMVNEELGKAKKPDYEDMIKPRRGGSTPANPRLYASVVQAAKDRFDVYPSAVANGWVVQEYKRRGGTYKMDDMEDMDKREFSGAARERMAESGTAMPDGSFPIGNRADLMNAIRSVGRAKNYDAARAHIIRRARALNAMDMLPEDWKNKATKGMTDWAGSIFDLNPFVK